MEPLTTRRDTLALGISALIGAAPFAASGFQDRNRSKSMTDKAQDQGLSPDLIPFISQPNVSMAVVAVVGVRWTRRMDVDLEVDSGPVTFQVVSAIHGTLRDGESIEVPAKRVVDPSARFRHNFDAWNTLALAPGERLILATRPGASPASWIGVAAKVVSAPDAPDVQAVRRAYRIEEARGDVAAKASMLDGALQSGLTFLVFYAIDYLRRHASERDATARILTAAAASPPPSEQKLEMGRALVRADFFRRAAKADPVNSLIVASLSNAFVQETEGSRLASWAQLVVSCILTDFTGDQVENRKIRMELIHAPGAPAANRVATAISLAESFATPDALPNLQELKRVWQTP